MFARSLEVDAAEWHLTKYRYRVRTVRFLALLRNDSWKVGEQNSSRHPRENLATVCQRVTVALYRLDSRSSRE